MRIFGTLGISLLATSHCLAATCDISAAAKEAFATQARLQSQTNAEIDGVRKQIEELTQSTEWSKMDDIRAHLPANDQSRLDSLLQRRKEFMLERLYEFKRLRDIIVISRMATIAKQIEDGAPVPEDKESTDYKLTGLVVAARDLLPIKLEEVVSYKTANSSCSFETALATAAHAATAEYMGYAQQLSGLKSLADKYGKPLKPEKMSAEDAARYREMLPRARKAYATATLSFDLMRIAKTEAASKLVFDARRADQNEAPGQVEHAGSTWTRWVMEGRVNQEQKNAVAILSYINDKFPTTTASTTSDAADEH
jgi:hypothetical protein